MKTTSIYTSPQIELIQLDAEISLALQSTDEPPIGPFEGSSGSVTPDSKSDDPLSIWLD